MAPIKNVAIAGAAGDLGEVVFAQLVASNKFNITVLRRNGSKSTYPAGTKVVDVDFESVDSLKAALVGQDAVVSTLASSALAIQKVLVDAAAAAGVQRFIPSEFGCDLGNPLTQKLPVFAHKVEVQEHLEQVAKSSQLSYTLVYNAAFLDWGLEKNFIFNSSEYKPVIYDSGDVTFTATTLSTVVDAIIGVLENPEETKNRPIFIESIKITQNQLLALAKQVAPEKPWEPKHVKLDDIIAVSNARLAQGLFDAETFVPYLFRAIFDESYGSNFQKTDNELLGLKQATEQDIIDIFKRILN
ncbi:hypothetical protein PT974_02235 [Cladobotryum mycophilum]|uniref:NmrA-like domain-containing protein n=1 Tax=Cladobotryum mycophilum TaxID=491253 RepID=A0ABR0SXM0_9HYPO